MSPELVLLYILGATITTASLAGLIAAWLT